MSADPYPGPVPLLVDTGRPGATEANFSDSRSTSHNEAFNNAFETILPRTCNAGYGCGIGRLWATGYNLRKMIWLNLV